MFNSKKKVVVEVKQEVAPLRPINEDSKEECLFLLSELKRLGIERVSNLENRIASL